MNYLMISSVCLVDINSVVLRYYLVVLEIQGKHLIAYYGWCKAFCVCVCVISTEGIWVCISYCLLQVKQFSLINCSMV